MEKHLTRAFIYDPQQLEVLLLKKSHGYYSECLNGIGGHVEESDASVLDAAYRELMEEAGISRSELVYGLEPLVTCMYPNEVVFHVFHGTLSVFREVSGQEDEPIAWYQAKKMSDTKHRVASIPLASEDGNTAYFINASGIAARASTKLKDKPYVVGQQVTVSVQTLAGLHSGLEHGTIVPDFGDGEGTPAYFDLYNTEGDLACCDGEVCTVVSIVGDELVLSNMNGEKDTLFILTMEEAARALFF